MRLVRVAVPVPALHALLYRVPDGIATPEPGVRVLVPLGRRVVTGCAIEERSLPERDLDGPSRHAGNGSREEVRDLIDVLDAGPFLPPDIVRLSTWVAEYYACGVGDALAAAMPPRAWIESERHAAITDLGHARLLLERGVRRDLLEGLGRGKPQRVNRLLGGRRGAHAALLGLERDGLVVLTKPLKGAAAAFRTIPVASITAAGLEAQGLGAPAMRLGVRQREGLDLLAAAPAGLELAALAERGVRPGSVARLVALGLASMSRRRVERDPFEQGAALANASEPVVLTAEQETALARLTMLARDGRYHAALLHGVTGSGKTEVYVRLAAEIRRSGRTVLLLVPEIALTPAVAGLFRRTFGREVAIQHSGLSDGERYDQWHRIRDGDIGIVVGTRSAVFAPLPKVGLVVVDEEHDASFKQDETPRYNGRDVAVMRARQAGALVLLGSATPSLESFHNASTGRYTLVTLARRVMDRPLAEVQIVDMRPEYAASGPDVILSEALVAALRGRLTEREQAIVLLNRRGFARAVFCRQCAATLECPNCSVNLTVHRAANRARCHYCNYSMAVPPACLRCAGPYLDQMGFGTERVEAEIRTLLPGARVARLDRDTIRRRGAIAELLERFAAAEIDILVGTQMIAKGHDFPRVTLVGVISADVGLGMADFRAAERTFQLLTQVAGRAGRGDIRGRAIVQTLYPDHSTIRHACRQDYSSFFRDELEFRRAMRYPPAVAMINVVVKGRSLEVAMEDCGEIVRSLRAKGGSYRVLGPATAPLSRLKGEYRAQLFIKGARRSDMREALMNALAKRRELKRRVIVDVDPMNVL